MLTHRNNLVGIDPVTRTLIAVPDDDDNDDAGAVREWLDVEGFVIVRGLLSPAEIDSVLNGLNREPPESGSTAAATRARRGNVFARRNLLDVSAVRELAASPPLRSVVVAVLGENARAVRGILFDKTPDANWLVPWHQDLSIAVRERRGVPGFGPWSVKAGVHHVQPPTAILDQMLTVRIHLDACPEGNGPLRVIPGSHRSLLSPQELEHQVSEQSAVTCCAEAGDVLLMRPMLAHTSAPARSPGHRRVLHLEFAACDLPGGLQWHVAQST